MATLLPRPKHCGLAHRPGHAFLERCPRRRRPRYGPWRRLHRHFRRLRPGLAAAWQPNAGPSSLLAEPSRAQFRLQISERRSIILIRDYSQKFGFGCSANAFRNVAKLLLSTTAVPVSTNTGSGPVGAVAQS